MEERRYVVLLTIKAFIIDRFILNFQFMMVTGGFDRSHLDTTEIFSDNFWRTVNAKLPSPRNGLKIATTDNRVLAFGSSLF